MPSAAQLPDGWPASSYDGQAEILVLAEQIGRMLAVAGALVAAARPVELTGLQDSVGLLCAKALDLPMGNARAARVALIRLVAQLDALSAAMRNASP
jgi:hypothetical protein